MHPTCHPEPSRFEHRPRIRVAAPAAVLLACALALVLAGAGCERGAVTSSPEHPLAVAPKPAPTGRPAAGLYAQYCASCHGTYGAADGPALALLIGRPADWTRPNAFEGRSDDALRGAILDGTPMPDNRPKPMPAFAESFSPEEIDALVAYIKNFAGKVLPEQRR